MDQKLTVVYAADRQIYKWLPLAVNSLFKNNPDCKVYIICEDDNIDLLKDSRITFINTYHRPSFIKPGAPQAVYYLPRMTFSRLWMADVIPEDRILWLDVDTIVDGDLTELWNTPLGKNVIAGVVDGAYIYPEISNTPYVNAGVLLFDLKKWRQYNLTKRCYYEVNAYQFRYGDQDILNKVCSHFIKYIDPRYNCGRYIIKNNNKPVIYHYPGHPKLWESDEVRLWEKYYTSELKEN